MYSTSNMQIQIARGSERNDILVRSTFTNFYSIFSFSTSEVWNKIFNHTNKRKNVIANIVNNLF